MHCVNYVDRVRLELGGVTRAVTDLCTVMSGLGHRVSLLTFDASDVPDEWLRSPTNLPKVIELPARSRPVMTSKAISTATAVINEADVVHLHALWDPRNRQLARIARYARKPYIQTTHGQLDDWSMRRRTFKKRLYLSLGGRRFLERAAQVHCTAEAEREQASKWFGCSKPCVLPYLFEIEPFERLPGPSLAQQRFPSLGADTPKILFLSRLHPKKGVELLIDAVTMLQQRGIGLRLMLAGPGEPGYRRQLERRVLECELGQCVEFLGMVSGREKLSLYEACDLFVLPSSQENFGFVLAEAMACRTPVVTTRGVDIWHELEEGGATIVDPAVGALASAIEERLSSPEALRERGQRGRQFILDWLDPVKVGRRYEAMYAQVVAANLESEMPQDHD